MCIFIIQLYVKWNIFYRSLKEKKTKRKKKGFIMNNCITHYIIYQQSKIMEQSYQQYIIAFCYKSGKSTIFKWLLYINFIGD